MNKLPNIFKGKAPRSINQESSIVKHEEEIVEEKSINKQIKDIFESERYVYKADTMITLKSGEIIKKTIIGKTNNSLITMDDELIDVNDISKIELV